MGGEGRGVGKGEVVVWEGKGEVVVWGGEEVVVWGR